MNLILWFRDNLPGVVLSILYNFICEVYACLEYEKNLNFNNCIS